MNNSSILSSEQIADLLTKHTLENSKPQHKDYHIINNGEQTLLFVVNGSIVKKLPTSLVTELNAYPNNDTYRDLLLSPYLDNNKKYIDHTPFPKAKTYAISLAIAQKCNLGCTYCYAAQGEFGDASKSMSEETAFEAIDYLLNDKEAGEKVQISFMGGEPLMNRMGIYNATAYAYALSQEKKVEVGFSITTNGTLLRVEDADFFEEYGFAVTISLDGNKDEHDLLRPMKNGKGSFEIIMKKIEPLLKIQKKMQVSARITVTPHNLNIKETLISFIKMGFHSVGLSPLVNAINNENELNKIQLTTLLTQMIDCGLEYEKFIMKGERFPFLNMINAYKEIEKQTHKPYPCGAGAGYLGVSADGELAACHRFVNNEKGSMGNLSEGLDEAKQSKWLAERHVLNQKPCHQCWARFLCGGGCHHEVIDVGRVSCDFIRGWLTFCLQSYHRISHLMNLKYG